MFDSAQRDMQRHAAFLPTLNQRPVDGTNQEMLTAAANESVFDFRKVREVIQEFVFQGWISAPEERHIYSNGSSYFNLEAP